MFHDRRILNVANVIEKAEIPNLGFNMKSWLNNGALEDMSGRHCRTTACMAGWTAFVAEQDPEFMGVFDAKPIEENNIPQIADKYLWLDRSTSGRLFTVFPEDVTPRLASRVMRNLVRDKEVSWGRAMEEIDELDKLHGLHPREQRPLRQVLFGASQMVPLYSTTMAGAFIVADVTRPTEYSVDRLVLRGRRADTMILDEVEF